MTEFSPSFRRALRLTTIRTLENQDDPELNKAGREIWGLWGDLRSVRVFSGVLDEGGEPLELKLEDGSAIKVRHMAHLNVDRAEEKSFTRHILTDTGTIYVGQGERYSPMGEIAIETLLDELELLRES